MPAKLLYRVPEAAEVTGISRSTLYELMSRGQLESIKVGRSRLIPHDALEEFIARMRHQEPDDATA